MFTGAGLVATPSPGSIFAYFAVTPKGGYVSIIFSILIAATVSFGVGSALLGFGRLEKEAPLETPEETGTHAVPAARPSGSAAPSHATRTATSEA